MTGEMISDPIISIFEKGGPSREKMNQPSADKELSVDSDEALILMHILVRMLNMMAKANVTNKIQQMTKKMR